MVYDEKHDHPIKSKWIKEQLELKKSLITEDDFPWKVPDMDPMELEHQQRNKHKNAKKSMNYDLEVTKKNLSDDPQTLHYIAGVDISFVKESNEDACAALVVLSFPDFEVVHCALEMVKLSLPYIPGFLAFREVEHLKKLIDDLRLSKPELVPQLIFVDGNGILHPRGFGLASHLGVLCNIPTIGVGKKLFVMDGITPEIAKSLEKKLEPKQSVNLVGESGKVWGALFRCSEETVKGINVSIGHKISLETAIKVLRLCSFYRAPEPIRHADLRSRDFIRHL